MTASTRSAHAFHIPVMGTGFTIDSPLHVARYGISSVISLVDDALIEQMRRYHSERLGRPFEAISSREDDARARRITAYLNFIHAEVGRQVIELQASPFEPGSEITRYYELLPEGPLKASYHEMLACEDITRKSALEEMLRKKAVPGGIDVNIMTKLDRVPFRDGAPVEQKFSDAMAALRGFALSEVSSSIIFSAGLNSHLYGYLAEFPGFLPNAEGYSKKTVTLKVSDYRSALIQGRFLAKRGIWVSEFRVESGLNCGGHAFATKGTLMGPILEEFKSKCGDLVERLHADYNKGLASRSLGQMRDAREMLITVQGGIGSSAEHNAMLQYYRMDRTGWATPFLLVPEVTCVDDEHLDRLCAATDEDVYLSDGSPMGIPFWNLKTSSSETARRDRIAAENPGSGCPKGYLRLSDEFPGEPLCRASRQYQAQKLEAIEQEDLSQEAKAILMEDTLAKACICHDLGGGATLKHGIVSKAYTAICPSSNIVQFSRLASLEEMLGHIYGRISLLAESERPHMFIRELGLYVDYLRKELDHFSLGIRSRKLSYYAEFKDNLLHGIQYYQDQFRCFVSEHQDCFTRDLLVLKEQLEGLRIETPA
ncbi:MAG: hypothetical protein HN341_05555 [Verrucomicrobia bacterium]|jgi:hypothetical protein|nr:hypothetical protein [Verrucomicrobiota bacterium]